MILWSYICLEIIGEGSFKNNHLLNITTRVLKFFFIESNRLREMKSNLYERKKVISKNHGCIFFFLGNFIIRE